MSITEDEPLQYVLSGSYGLGQEIRVFFTHMSVCTYRRAHLKLNHQVLSIFGFTTADTRNKISFYVDGILLNVTKLYICMAARSVLNILRSYAQVR